MVLSRYFQPNKSMLILFSVRRTDRSNAKFATFSSGKTDNARCCRDADILPLSLSGAELATDTSIPDLPCR